MDSIFGMCCVNRQKDDLRHSERLTASRPSDFIRQKPRLVNVLGWYEDIDNEFREGMKDVSEPLEKIVGFLDSHSHEDMIELSRGEQVVAKVVDKRAVVEAL